MAEADWVRPTSHADYNDQWENEELAYDGDLATFARLSTYSPFGRSGRLHLMLAPVRSDEVRIFVHMPIAAVDYMLRVFDGTNWGPYREWTDQGGLDWHSYKFEPQIVEQVEVTLSLRMQDPGEGGLAECIIHVACGGPLAPICDVFYALGDWFAGLADDIADVMFVGDALSAPFRTLADTLNGLGDTCCEVSANLQEILDMLEGGISWGEISAMILDHWPTLRSLVSDPVGWFLVQLTEAFGLEPYHTQSLEFLAKWILEEYFPTLYLIWRDPDAWIAEHIAPLAPALPDWLDDPLAWLTDMLEENFPLLYYLVVDPGGELLYLIAQLFELEPYQAQTGEMVVKALFERYFPSLYKLWRDPAATIWSFLLDKFEDVFESISARLYYLAEVVLRFFWEGVALPRAETTEIWIAGVVTEAESPGIAGAVVTVVGTALSDTTDEAGRYEIKGQAVAAPSYTLSVRKPGYRDTVIAGVVAQPGVPATVNVGMEYKVMPPEQNPAPRLARLIEVYRDTQEKLAWTQDVLETKRGGPTEPFWRNQVDQLITWLEEACNDIQVAQTELQLYYGETGVPAEYASLLEFRC